MRTINKVLLTLAAITLMLSIVPGALAALETNQYVYYSFDDANISGTTVYDLTSASRDATSSGTTSGVSGIINEDLEWNTANNYVDTNANFPSGTNGWSISYWFNADTWNNAPMHFMWDDASSNRIAYSQQISSGNTLKIVTNPGGTGSQVDVSIPSPTNQWYHVVITVSSAGELKVYFDGVLNGTDATGISTNSKSTKIRIGHHITLPGGYNFDGNIDEFGYWQKVLNSTEISELYNSGSGLQYPYVSANTNATITAENSYTGAPLSNFTAVWNGTTYNTTTATITLPIDKNSTSLWNISVSADNYFTNTSLNVNLSTNHNAIMWPYTEIYAQNGNTNATINSFNLTWNGTEYSTSSGTVYIPLYDLTETNVSIPGLGDYNDDSALLNATPYLQNYTFSLYPDPSAVRIYLYDANTGTSLTENITVVASGNTFSDTQSTTSGTFYIANLTAGIFTFTFSGTNYTTQTYTLTVGENTYQELNAWLSTNTSDLRFILRDWDSAQEIEGVTVVMQRIVNNTWVSVESKLTDITGRSLFQYVENVRYRFVISKTGYQTRTFELNPVDPTIAASGYTVRLRKDTTQDNTQNFAGVVRSLTPSTYSEGNNTITYSVFSPDAALSSYGITAIYPGGSASQSGSDAYGSILTVPINISGALIGDTVNITYWYVHTVQGNRSYNGNYFIEVNATAYTWGGIRDTDYGFTQFEKVLIAIIGTIIIAGFGFLFAGALGGGIMTVIMFALFYWIGFLTLWMILPSLFALIFLIIWRASS